MERYIKENTKNIKFNEIKLVSRGKVKAIVKSIRGTQFRILANKLIKEYLIKGYNLDVDRFKNNGGGVYFEEALEKIRDIRSSEKELDMLNRMVSAYLDVAEINALNMHPMTMKDWVKELDGFLTMSHKEILEGAGKISHEKALEKAHKK